MCKEIDHENEPCYLNLAARLATYQLIVIIYIQDLITTIVHMLATIKVFKEVEESNKIN